MAFEKILLRILVIGILALLPNRYMCAFSQSATEISDSVTYHLLLGKLLRESTISDIKEEHGELARHVVERGESWASIAKAHGIGEVDLMTLNYMWDDLHAGIEIDVPQYPRHSIGYERAAIWSMEDEYNRAQQLLDAGEWKKAAKAYGKLKDEKSTLAAWYLQGIAYYNMNKYKQAIENMTLIVNRDDYGLYPDAADIRNSAQAAWDEKKARRAEMWSGLAQGLLQSAAAGVQAYYNAQAMNYQPAMGSNYASSTYTGAGPLATAMSQPGYFQNVSNQLMQLSYNQVNFQLQQEYETVRQNYLKFGTDLTYDQFIAMKAAAYAEVNGTSTTTEPKVRKTAAESLNETLGEYCLTCHGDKRCTACGGTKVARGMGLTYACTLCNDTGDCPTCHGTGLAGWNR